MGLLRELGRPRDPFCLFRFSGRCRRPAAQTVSTFGKTLPEFFVQVCPFPAYRFQEVAVAVLDDINRTLALAHRDNVLDVTRPLLPALHRLRDMGLSCKPVA